MVNPVAGANVCWQSLWPSLCPLYIHTASAAVCSRARKACPSSCVDSGPSSYATSCCSSGHVTTGQSSNSGKFGVIY
jgi:hypothetical protein